jgi:hypothetical protein
VGRAAIREDLQEARQVQQVEPVPPGGIALRGQDARVEAVPGLVIDPVLIPVFLAVLPLQRLQPLVPEKLDEQPNGRGLKVFRSAGLGRRGVERERIKRVA